MTCSDRNVKGQGQGQSMRQPLSFFLEQHYPFSVTPDPDGGYFISFPDLLGCMAQVEDSSEIGPMAEEIRTL